MTTEVEQPVSEPTYMEHIRTFFEDVDLDHMRDWFGIELGTYEGLKVHALRTYIRVNEGTMPPDPARRWSPARVQTFYNWLKNGCPRGNVSPKTVPHPPQAGRIRKNLTALSDDEAKLLKKAFRGIMARPEENPQSYFAIAGLHWLPGPDLYCRHHENAYNPWHRAYLQVFEDALRSVPDCADVTLPYWDISSSEIPAILSEDPFDAYTIRPELCTVNGVCYGPGHRTVRHDAQTILDEIDERNIRGNIAAALGHAHWERFNGWDGGRTQDGIIRAHDAGHNAGGATLANQDIAAFEPLFWFFHANWDRLWWKWQQDFKVTTPNAFKSTLQGSSDWLDDPVINGLPPFEVSTIETIDLRHRFDVDYEHPVKSEPIPDSAPRFGHLSAARSMRVHRERVSVRVGRVDRLAIPGSFDVDLYAGDTRIGRQGFFQSTSPRHCETCRKNALVSFDFEIEPSDLDLGNLSVQIQMRQPDGGQVPFPLSVAGDPSINIRLLLEER